MNIADIVKIIQEEHQYWESARIAEPDFDQKNRLVTGEITCERILHKIKQAGYEIHTNE